MATNIGTAILEFKTDASGISAGVAQIQKDVGGLQSTLKGVGAALAASFSVDAIAGVARQVMDKTSEIADATARMGVSSAEAAQKLKYAAEQGGATVDHVGTAIKTMAGHLNDPSKGALAAFADLKLNIDDLKKMAPEEALTTIADAIAKVPDPMKQSAIATDLFGKAGVNLLPAIKAGLTEVGNQAPLMSNAVVKAGDDMGDSWQKTQEQIDVLKAQALTPLLETFVSMPQSAQIAIGGLAQLAPAFGSIMPAVIAAGGPIAAFKSIGSALSLLFTGPAAPFILAGVAIAGLVVLIVKHWDEIKAATKAFVDTIGGWFSSAWEGVKTVTTGFVTSIREAFGRLGDFFKEYWPALLGPAGLMFVAWKRWGDDVTRIVQNFYTAVKTWLVDKFGAIVDAVKGKIDAVTGFFQDMYDKVVGHSSVPDMIDGIEAEFGRLPAVMVRPSQDATRTVADSFDEFGKNVTGTISRTFGDMLTGATGFKDGFIGIWQSLRSALGDLLGDIAENVIGGFVKKGTDMLGQFFGLSGAAGGGGGGGLSGLAGGLSGLISKGVGAIGSGLSSLGGFLANPALWTNPWTIGIAAGGLLAKPLIDHFRGGEEGIHVNPARDKFSGQFIDRYGLSSFDSLAAAFAEAQLPGYTAEAAIKRLQDAETMDAFRAAEESIKSLLTDSPLRAWAENLQVFHSGGMVPGWGEVNARLLGGERILSRVEADAYNRDLMAVPQGLLNPRTDNTQQLAEVKKEIAGLRASIERDNRDLPFVLTNAIKSALALA